MLTFKKDRTINYATLIFLVVFALLRVSQYYNAPQYATGHLAEYNTNADKLNLEIHHPYLSKQWDKYYVEKIYRLSVPPIKFSGIVFFLSLFGFVLLCFKDLNIPFPDRRFFVSGELCPDLCISRLWSHSLSFKGLSKAHSCPSRFHFTALIWLFSPATFFILQNLFRIKILVAAYLILRYWIVYYKQKYKTIIQISNVPHHEKFQSISPCNS